MVGDIVLTPFPYTDLSAEKIRPAVVLADVRAGEMEDWILCEVTSRNYQRPGDITIVQSDLQSGRLALASCARPGRLHTLDSRIFIRTIGRLTDAKLAEVLAAVRGLF